jgi:hypothetical protein
VLLVFGAPGQFPSLAGQEDGRAIPLADLTEVDLTKKVRPAITVENSRGNDA